MQFFCLGRWLWFLVLQFTSKSFIANLITLQYSTNVNKKLNYVILLKCTRCYVYYFLCTSKWFKWFYNSVDLLSDLFTNVLRFSKQNCKELIDIDSSVLQCCFCYHSERSKRTPRRKEVERRQQLDVERWLKNKFREGFANMREAFEAKDPKSEGSVSHY